MLIGDFNARVGERCCSIPRTSPDKGVTTRGRRILEMCEDLSFELLNGSALHKHESRDRFTSFQALGSTVIDLCLASASLIASGSVLSFAVLEVVRPCAVGRPRSSRAAGYYPSAVNRDAQVLTSVQLEQL